METAEIQRIFPINYDPYLKGFLFKIKVKCPHCKRIMKHGALWDDFSKLQSGIRAEKQCLNCRRDYRIVWNNV